MFVARLLLRFCQHTLRGMPNNVKIDPNIFLSSIKYQDKNGDTCSVEPWRFGELIANMSAEERKEYSEAWDIVDKHAASTHIFIPHVAQHKKAHRQDKTFCCLAGYKGHPFKYRFQCPRNHEGFNDESNDEDEEPDIFGNEDINERNYNSQTKNTKKRKGKQGRKGNKKRKEDDNEPVNMDYESDVDMDAIVYVTSTSDSSEEDNYESEDNRDHTEILEKYNAKYYVLKDGNLTPFEDSLSYTNLQCAGDQLALDIKRFGAIPTVTKDTDSKLTIHDMAIYNRPIGMRKNPFEIQMLQVVAGMWSKVKHAKACSAKDNIQERINRQHAMVAHGFSWDWVECACVIEIKAIMTDPSNSCTPWIASLICKVQSFIETRSAGQLELQRKDQLLFSEMEPMIAMVMGPHTAGGHAPFLLDTDLKDYVLKEMISVITQWLQYPKEKTISAVQGKFVNMLLTITNSYNIFLLNATWKAYCLS
ncbi:hypothetical protein K439DRAFT_1621689 [Ramaria rubella]|nr:hypothetical protein K439DRAFT_1621689 [Ramaria rubella]